jgi:hypothetical protein
MHCRHQILNALRGGVIQRRVPLALIHRMNLRTVFISAATADYSAARSVLQRLTEQGRRCFFCDEALLRAGETGYSAKVDAALAEAEALVVVAGRRERADAEWVRYAWRRFGESPGRHTVTILSDGMTAEELPRTLRRGTCLTFPQELDSLDRALVAPSGASPPSRSSGNAGARRSVRLIAAMTVCNALMLGAIVWLLVKNGGRFFPPRTPGVEPGASYTEQPGGSPVVSGQPAPTGTTGGEVSNAGGADSLAGSGESPALAGTPVTNRLLRDADAKFTARLGGNPSAGTACQISVGGDLRETFSFIPAGSFLMGSPPDETARGDDETLRRVEIGEGFWLARAECTTGFWRSVTGSAPEEAGESAWFPVHSVSWEELTGSEDSFLTRLNQRRLLPAGWRFALPTEEQWEYACRAGTATPFSFGSVLDGTRANCDGNLPYGTKTSGPWLGRTAEVGSYSPNGWGLYDMHGNVWEWCADRIRRGGGWRFGAAQCRSANRDKDGEHGDDALGFRLAIVPEE